VDAGPEVNSKQPRVGDEYAVGGIRLQTSLPPPDRGRCLPELPATSRASCLLLPEPSTSSRAFDCLQTSRPLRLYAYTTSIRTRPPYVHGLQTSIRARLLDLYASSTRAISTNTIKREEKPRHSDGGQDSRHK
jgi:hypothetical protein